MSRMRLKLWYWRQRLQLQRRIAGEDGIWETRQDQHLLEIPPNPHGNTHGCDSRIDGTDSGILCEDHFQRCIASWTHVILRHINAPRGRFLHNPVEWSAAIMMRNRKFAERDLSAVA